MKMLMIALLLSLVPTPIMAQQGLFKDGVGIASTCVVMPVGRMLLINRDNFVGAIKFAHNEERSDGIMSGYESFEYRKGRFEKVGEGEVSLKKQPSRKGIFLHGSPDKLAGPPMILGNFKLFATAGNEHSTVYFGSKPNKVDLRVRMAPTPWKEMAEVNQADPRIRWFTYDDKKSWKVVPIDKIWD